MNTSTSPAIPISQLFLHYCSLGGYKVQVAPSCPKMVLSKSVPVSEAFRAEMDEWLLNFFGYTCVVERDHALVNEQTKTLLVHYETYTELKKSFFATLLQSQLTPYNLDGAYSETIFKL